MKNYRCPACGGDGKETCNNPDHGFIQMCDGIGHDIGRLGCPCCGHDEDYKITKYINGKSEYLPCFECKGTGIVTEKECETILDEWGIDQPTDDFLIQTT